MAFHYLWIFPILSTGFAVAAFIAGYSIAVGNNDANAWFMYISDGGAHPPESCVFGQLLNLSALFLAISVYLRHRQYVVYYGDYHLDRRGRWRTVSFLLMFVGFISAFGMSLVANFQETSVALVHFIGAMMAFFGAAVYCWGQIFLAYALTPYMAPLWLNHIRTILTALGTGALVLHMICQYVSPFVKTVNGIKPTEPPKDNGIERYDEDSPFYTNHLVTTCAEWGLALTFEFVILTFAWEMQQFYAHLPKLYIKQNHFVAPTITTMETTKIIQTNGNHSATETTSSTQSSTQIIPRAKLTAKVAPKNYKRNEYVY